MGFAQLPSSPGFVPPQAPSWAPFAQQANELIQRGGEMRAAAGKDFADSISKSAAQIDEILRYNSPEGKAKRRLEMIQMQAMTQMYEDYRLHPDKYQLTAHGPILRDPFEQALKAAHYRSSVLSGDLNALNIKSKQDADRHAKSQDDFRNTFGNFDASQLPPTGSTAIPAGAPGGPEGTQEEPPAAPASAQDFTPAVQDTSITPVVVPFDQNG